VTSSPGEVAVRRDGPVAVLTLVRPEKLNALSSHLEESLLASLSSEEVRTAGAVVVTGGMSVFSAGADLDELRAMSADDIASYYAGSGGVYEVVAALPQPTVSAIAGWCVGGGLELALCTDFRVASLDAVFALPEVSIGIVPSSGGTYRLTRMVGPARARDLILSGRRMTADEALAWGLVSSVVPAGEHIKHAVSLAASLAEQPLHAIAHAKRLIDTIADGLSREEALRLEQDAYISLNDLQKETHD